MGDSCGNCKYMAWFRLAKWCRHPDHVVPLKNPGGKCALWLHEDVKHMEHEVPAWEYPVSLTEAMREKSTEKIQKVHAHDAQKVAADQA